ncbi:PREDICTED: vestitone reductase-like [Nelumbo nucifera]|uniref:Vestitone reductase-like n=1 Tax=Nelumbo nucifera TaxID=4432 RepID=A0A1U8Q728_NELNU|nr:PREDICTED: vestitone reductase-like [Nelumbo nucifera]
MFKTTLDDQTCTCSSGKIEIAMNMETKSNNTKVCVTGAAGYLGSWLTRKLLQKGYIVHATLRNPDIYNPDEFEPAIEGCEFVFHLATPLQHNSHSWQFKDTSEAAVAGVRRIVQFCIRSGTVKRLIYTASVVAASPLKDDGISFKDLMDDSCWTNLPLSPSFPYGSDPLKVAAGF